MEEAVTAVKASAAKMKTIHHEMSGAGVQETTFSTPIPQPPSAEDRVGAETVGARRSFFEGEWSQKWSTGHTASVTIDLSEASTDYECVWKVSNNMWHKVDCRLAVPEITSVDGSYCFSGPTRRWMDLRHPSASDDTIVWVTDSKDECYRRMMWHRKEPGTHSAGSFAIAFPRS